MFQFLTDAAPVSLETIPTELWDYMLFVLFSDGGTTQTEAEENPDPVHFKIDEKPAAILLFYFKNGRICAALNRLRKHIKNLEQF